MKKRFLAFACACMLTVAALVGCGAGGQGTNSDTDASAPAGDQQLSVVTTIFPAYDWTRAVLGDAADDAELTMLLSDGTDLHSYQPTVEDLAKVADCDVFVYVGGESDEWVADALANAQNPDMVVVNLLDLMGSDAKEEEIIEGMEADHDHDHDHDHATEGEEAHDHDHDAMAEEHDHDHDAAAEEHDHDHDHAADTDHDHDHDHAIELDEHVWLSLNNARTLTTGIAEALAQADPAHADDYAANAKAYGEQLDELDARYQQAVKAGTKDTLLFGDRFPFRYLVDDYDLSYYAAFVGCSAESEASFETIAFLSDKVDELGLNYVMAIEGPSHDIAQAVIDNTKDKDQEVLVMDSMQSTTSSDVEAGATYLSIMEENLAALEKALA